MKPITVGPVTSSTPPEPASGSSRLPATARETTAESPWPVRTLSLKISDYIDKMSGLWVEGQIVQLNRRPGMKTVFLTLRDTDVDMSLSVSIPGAALDAMPSPPTQGTRVVVQAKPTFWTKRGTLQLEARQMRHVGVGELLARIEHLKQLMASEGLFDPSRRKPLPFLPRRIGLITGRKTAAERDIVVNTRRRWPGANFEIRQVAVQGPDTVPSVTKALAELDAIRDVDVIVIARGGGSFEDLLPFSNEALVRAVSAARTPIVSAIGHETDSPLLDYVADLRASTPTHAASSIVPDHADEVRGLLTVVRRGRGSLSKRIDQQRERIHALLTRPVMANRSAIINTHRADIDQTARRGNVAITRLVDREHDRLQALARHLRAVSPQQTLERGYAVVRNSDGHVIRSASEVAVGDALSVLTAQGDFAAQVAAESGS